jgi:glycine/D-amino acid oxidase-like deaminating enzyme
VFVVEKGRVAGEQSSRNWGWIRQLGRDEAELPIMMEASRLWEQIDGETGNRTGFRRTGIMYLASTDKEMESGRSGSMWRAGISSMCGPSMVTKLRTD